MNRISAKLLISGILATIAMAAATLGTCYCSEEGLDDLDISPLYDYRYNQAAEDIGILGAGISESKVSLGSIQTSSLKSQDPYAGSDRQTARQIGAQTSQSSCGGATACGSISTCGRTCADSCGGSCSATCGTTCADSCGGTCISTCSSTCTATCRYSCAGTCDAACGRTNSVTCSNSCAGTCSASCSSTCTATCRYSCAGTCIAECGSTYSVSCSISCGGTCSASCSSTCSSTCESSCGGTCYVSTCASTCSLSCSPTCSQNCISAPAPARPLKAVPSANFTAKAPPESEANVIIECDAQSTQPASVYYRGNKMPWAEFGRMFDGNQLLSWVETASKAWDVNATAPKGTWIREIVYVPVSGNLTLKKSSGNDSHIIDYGYATPGYRYVWFDVDWKGVHVSTFALEGLQSNDVTISAP